MAKRYSQAMTGTWRGMLQRHSSRSTSSIWQNELLNWRIQGGVPVSRPGIRPFTGAAFPAVVRGMAFHVNADGTFHLLAACANGKLYRCFQGGDPIELSMAGLPVAEQTRVDTEIVNFISISGGRNTTIIYDGVNPNLKWDGVQLSRLGIAIPTQTPEPTEDVGLIEAGTRNYVHTLVSPYFESSPSNESAGDGNNYRVVTQTANKKQTFPSPVQGTDFDDPQVTMWRLWRTAAGGSELKFIGEADIGTPIEDNVPDVNLIGRDPVEELVSDPPPSFAVCMCEHRGQLIGVFADDTNILRFTNVDPDYMVTEGWPRNFTQPVAHGDGDEIKAVASFFDWVIVFKNNAAYAVVGDSFSNYQVVPILASANTRQGIGCFAPGSIRQVENELQWASRDGIYSISRFSDPSGGLKAKRISGPIDDLYTAARYSLGSSSFSQRKKRYASFNGHG